MQKEHRVKGGLVEKPENKTFTEETFAGNTGNSLQGEGGSEFTGSKKLRKKQRQAEKAGKKVQKARAKLPKTREYTLQRVFDEKTGKGKYVVVPLDKEKAFKQEGIPKTTIRRVQNESKNFVHEEYLKSLQKQVPYIKLQIGCGLNTKNDGKVNVVDVNPKLLEKMQNDSEAAKEYTQRLKDIESATKWVDGWEKSMGYILCRAILHCHAQSGLCRVDGTR